MSDPKTVVDVIISGSTTTVVDTRVDGVTTVAGTPPLTNVSGQIPDLGVTTSYLAGQGEILSLINDIANLRANVIITGKTLTDEIGVVSGALISTGNYLESNIITLSGNLIASGNNLDSLRDILSGNLITTGRILEQQLQNNDVDISVLKAATGTLQDQKFDKTGGVLSGDVTPSSSGTLTLGTAAFPFKSGFFEDLTVSNNTLYVGDIAITATDTGGLDFEGATGTTFFKDVSIRNLTVTGTETIIDVDNLAIKDNKIILNSGESGAGITLVTGGVIIDRGTLTDADLLFNEANKRFEFNFPLALEGNLAVTANQTGTYADAGNLITTGQTLTSEIGTVSGLITDNDGDIAALKTATGVLKTSTDDNTANLITTGQTLTTNISTVSANLVSTGSIVDDISGNLITTGQTLTSEIGTVSGLITDNDGDIADLKTATGILKTSTDSNASNLISTGNFLDSEIAIVSGLAGGSVINELSGNLITTGQTLQVQITSNDNDISTLTSNLISTGSMVDDISGNLITTGQTLQTQITSNDSDISTLTTNLITTGQYLTDEIAIVSGIAGGGGSDPALSGKVDTLSGNLITTGQTLQTQITSNDSDISTLTSNLISTGTIVDDISGNLITTGQTLTTNINTVSTNLITTGQTLQTQITSNDGDITNLTTNLITTGQTLTSEIGTVSGLITDNDAEITALLAATGELKTNTNTNASNLVTTGQTLTSEISIVSGIAIAHTDISELSGNLITTGQTLQTQITSNDGDIASLTSNLVTTGQTLTSTLISTGNYLDSEIATVSGIASSHTDVTELSGRVNTLSGNLITTGQTLQTQITSNDGDITNLTSNLITTGQTLTTEITTVSGLITDNDGDITALKAATGVLKTSTDNNTANLISTGAIVDDISGNLITSGQTLQTQITSNDSDISTLTSNVITTGQTLQTQITNNDSDISALTSNLVTTGQTLTTNINTVSTNLVSTGSVVDDISGNLITTGQTLQTQITSNDSDISTLTSNLVTTGQTLTTNVNTVASNLVSTGSVVDDISGNLITTGQTLQTQITSNDGDITSLTSNLITTGQTLQTQITSNDADIATLDSTTVKLTTNQSVAGNKIFTDTVTINNLTVTGTEVIVDVENLAVRDNIIHINSGESGAGISRISGGITIDRGTEPSANILYNDANDRFELNFPLATEGNVVASAANLITTGQTLTTSINTVSTNLVSTGSVVDDISGNLITTGQTLQTQITSNDGDISTLTSNLVTTGQTLTTNINTVSTNLVSTGAIVDDVSGNLITTGQTLQTQITSNDTDITNLSSNLVTTGQTLTTNIDTVATNLVTTGQTLTSEINTVSGLIPPTVVDGAGVTGYTARWYDGNTLTTGALYDNGTRIGIGTNTPDYTLDIVGTVGIDNYIYHNGDDDTYLKFEGNEVNLVAGGKSMIKLDYNNNANDKIQINNTNADIDVQVMADDGEVILHTDAGTNRVGIGTDAPGHLLVVAGGDVQILSVDPGPGTSNPTDGRLLFDKVFDNSGEATANKIVLYDDGGVGAQWKGGIGVSSSDIDFFSGDNFRFWTNHGSTTEGDNRLTILADGKVGIGTTAPTTTLHLYTTSGNNYLKIENQTTSQAALWWKTGTTDASWIAYIPSSSSDLRLYAGADKVTFKTDGNVGIGTITPPHKLSIYGTGAGKATVQIEGEGGADPYINFLVNNTTHWALGADDDSSDSFKISQHSALGTNDYFTLSTAGAATFSGSLKATTILDTNDSAGTNGQVLTTTGSALDWKTLAEISGVDGSGTANYLSKWTDTDTIGNSNILDNGTNVGISTNNPVGLLDIIRVSNTAPALRIGSSATYGWGFFSRASTGDLSIERDNNTTYSPTLYLKRADGNVGIGTNAPSAKLHVDVGASGGAIIEGDDWSRLQLAITGSTIGILNDDTINAFSIYDWTSSAYRMVVNTSGNVGIGTTAPSTKLHLADSSDVYLTLESTHASTPEEVAVKYSNYSTGSYFWWQGLNQETHYSLAFGDAYSGANIKFKVQTDGNVLVASGSTILYGDGDALFSGAAANMNWDKSDSALEFQDNAKIKLGTSGDLEIYHDGSNSYVSDQGTGQLILLTNSFRVNNAANSENIITAEENGAVNLFYNDSKKLETTSAGVTVTGGVTATAANGFTAGTAFFYSASSIDRFGGNAATTRLYANGAQVLELTSTGLAVTGNATFADNGKAIFGGGNDLKLYHDGSNSHIKNTGSLYVASETSGDLYLRSDDDIFIQPQGGENGITLTGNGAVTLYYDNAVRLATTSTGVNFNVGATIANNQPLNIGTTGNNTGYIRFYNNNATAYYQDWESTGPRAYRYHGTSSGSPYVTTFSQAGSGGHDLVVTGGITTGATIQISRSSASPLFQVTDADAGGGAKSRWFGLVDGTSRFAIYGTNGSTEEFKLDDGGAATFSGALAATSATFSNNVNISSATYGYQIAGTPVLGYVGGNVVVGDLGAGVALEYIGATKLLTTSTGVTVTGALKTTTILDTNNSAGTNGQVLVSTGAALDWKTLSEISGVDGTGTANYISKWTDADTIGNSSIFDNDSQVTIDVPVGIVAGAGSGTLTGRLQIGSTTSSANNSLVFWRGAKPTLAANQGAILYESSGMSDGEGMTFMSDKGYKFLDDAGTTEWVRIISDGNVGIGTTAPSADLEVSTASGGEFLVTRSGNSGVTLQQVNGGDATSGSLSIKAGTAMTLYTNGTGRALTIDSSQKVGIGTATPADLLHLDSSGHTEMSLDRGSTSYDATLKYRTAGTADWQIGTGLTGTDAKLTWYSSAAKMTLTTDGKLGIGTATPAAVLDIRGDDSTSAGSGLIIGQDASTDGGTTLVPNAWLKFYLNSIRNGAMIKAGRDNTYGSASHADGNLQFHTALDDTLAEHMRITSAGSVGIGTNAPQSLLHVNGPADGTGYLKITDSVTGAGGGDGMRLGYNSGELRLQNFENSDIAFFLQTTERVTFKSDGNVGIGTVAPSSLLEIGASVNTTDQLQINGPSSTTKLHLGQFSNASYIFSNFRYRAAQTADSSSLGSVGIILQSDSTSGTIAFQRATPSATPARVTSMLIANDGKVGIGVIPATDWDSAHEAIQLGLTASLFSGGAATGWTQLMKNGRYVGGGVYKYITTDEATRYNQKNDGTHHFDVAPSGTANAAITFTTALSILNDGKVGIGVTAPGQRLSIVGSGTGANTSSFRTQNSNNSKWLDFSDGGYVNLTNLQFNQSEFKPNNTDYTFKLGNLVPMGTLGYRFRDVAGTVLMDILNTGKVGIGTNAPTQKLEVRGNAHLEGAGANLTINATSSYPYINMEEAGTLRYQQAYDTVNDRAYFIAVQSGSQMWFGTANVERMRIDSSGKVGIGTNAPAYKLDVAGDIRVGQGQSTGILHSGGDLQFYADGTKVIEMWTSGSDHIFKSFHDIAYFSESNVKVGLGTTSPEEKLHIAGTEAVIKLVDTAATSAGYVDFDGVALQLTTNRNPNTGAFADTSKSHANISLSGANGGSKILFYTANANNTTGTQRAVIEADGTLDLKSAKFKINGSAGSSGQTLTTDGSGNISWSAAGSGTISGSGTDNYIPRFNGTNALQDSAVYASDAGDLGFGTTSPSSTIHLANGRQIRIDKSGNAGRYTIYDYAGINTAPANDGFSIKLGGDTKFKFINDRLGIGNTSPAKALHIGDAANVTGNGTIRLQGYSAGGSGNYHDIVSYGDNLTFYRNSTMCLFLQYNGNVGIGTTAPADVLHVYGPGNVALFESSSANSWLKIKGSTTYSWQIGSTDKGLQFYNDETSAYRVVFKKDGNVGIGTVTPTALLHLNFATGGYAKIGYATDKWGGFQFVENGATKAYVDYGAYNTTDGFTFYAGGGSSSDIAMKIKEGGGVIIAGGAAEPGTSTKLQVAGRGLFTGGTHDPGDGSPKGLSLTFESNVGVIRALQTAVISYDIAIQPTSGGNVGIGTTAPAARLAVLGATGTVLRLDNEATAHAQNPHIELRAGPGGSVYGDNWIRFVDFSESKSWALGQDDDENIFSLTYAASKTAAPTSSPYLAVKEDGNVGIGTNAPAAELHVYRHSTGFVKIQNQSEFIGNTGGNAWRFYNYDTGGSSLWVSDGSTTSLIVKGGAGGSVGIGTATPTAPLEVRGADSGITISSASANRPHLRLVNGTTNMFQLSANGTYAAIGDGTDANRYMGFYAGKVGVNTIAPDANLDIKSAGDGNNVLMVRASDNDVLFNVRQSANDCLVRGYKDGGSQTWEIHSDGDSYFNGGSVGIGTSAPVQNFHIAGGSSTAYQKFTNDAVGNTINDGTSLGIDADGDFLINNAEAKEIKLYTSDTHRVTISSDGTLDLKSSKFKINGSGGTNGYTIVTDGSGNISWSSAGTGTVTGSGTDNYVPRWNGTTALQNSALFSNDNGNVGIGTTVPGTLLHLRKYDTVGPTITMSNNPKTGYINWWGAGAATDRTNQFEINAVQEGYGATIAAKTYVRFKTDGLGASDERMRITNTGVGIGTTAPANALHVYSTTGNASAVLIDGSASNSGFLSFRQSGVEKAYIQYTSNSYLRYFAAGGHNFAQNVGINKTVPDSWLHIEDDNSLTKHLLHIKGGGASGAYGVLVEAANGTDLFKIDTLSYKVTMPSGYSVGIGNDAPVSLLHVQKYDSGNYTGEIRVGGSSTAHGILTSYTQLSATEGSIHVAPGYANSSALFKLRCSTNNTNQLVLKGDGKVGIGTDAPAYLFHVKGAAADIVVQSTTGTNRTGYQAANTGGASYFYRESSSGGGAITGSAAYATVVGASAGAYPLQLGTNNAVRLTIDSAGKVGIGTATPAWDLTLYKSGGTLGVVGAGSPRIDVMNTAGSKGLRIEKSADAYSTLTNYDGGAGASLTLQGASAGGNVGIGTATPAAKLDVNGDVRIGNSTRGHYLGEKALTVNGTTYTTALTIVLSDHNAAHVKLFLTGDWSGHSAVAYVGEYFIQNGAGGYAEPGMIISEFDNTHTDFIESKIVDPSTDTFTIQLKLSDSDNGSLGGHICYHVMGEVTSVT